MKNGVIIESQRGWLVPDDRLPDLEQIYQDYHAKVLSYATRLLGRDEADDVSQEVFIKIGRSLATLTDPSRLTSWIYAITLNTVRDVARKRSASPDRYSLESSPGDPASTEGPMESVAPDPQARTPEESAIRNEMVTCYVDYVKQLPEKYYGVYVLSEFAHLPAEEIAKRLSLTVGTVKIRLHRARTRLHDELRRNCHCYFNDRGELMGEPKRVDPTLDSSEE